MDTNEERWVPKVHPLARDAEPEDPLELVPHHVAGDPDQMLDSILQEFAWMGCGAEELLALFWHPNYPLLRELRAFYGDEEIRRRVEGVIARWGVFRCQERLVEEEQIPELVQVTPNWERGQ